MDFKKIILAKDVILNISGELMKFDIHRNEKGNLDIIAQDWDYEKYPEGLYYGMLNDELTLSFNAQ